MTTDPRMMTADGEARPVEDVQLRGAPRHPCQVTADRLGEHADKFAAHITPAELAALRLTVAALLQVPGRELAAREAAVTDRA